MFSSSSDHTRTRSALGIDIGPGSVKGIVIEEDDGVLTVTHAYRLPTPSESVDKGVITNVPSVAAVLRQLVKQCGGKFRTATMAVPAEQSLVRWIDIPVLDEGALRAATPFEARKYLNYPANEADVQIVADRRQLDPDATTMKGLFIAAPKAIVESRAQVMRSAGLEVSCLEPEAFALMRALYKPNLKREMVWNSYSRAYLQLGEDTSSMYVLQEGVLRFVRAIAWGSSRLTDALATELRCSREEAQAIKESKNSALDESGGLTYYIDDERRTTNALGPEFDRLCREIQRLMSYYQSLYAEGSYEGNLNEITLCGGTAGLKGVQQYMSVRLEIDFDTSDPFLAQSLRLTPHVQGSIHGFRAGYSVAIGLSLGELQHARPTSANNNDTEYIWKRAAA